MSDHILYIKCPKCIGEGCASCGNGFVEATQDDIYLAHSNCDSCHYCDEYAICLNDQSPFDIVYPGTDYCPYHVPKDVK